jgi:L-ascorbate metabolism protein UlaG (beta-lactamase superfamily)
MKALQAIDVAFVCMNLPYTMPPKEAAACVDAFKPKVLFPYHYGVPGGGAPSNLDELEAALDPKAGVEVRVRKWY